jgi:cell wall-associated NlpC family hydrolase
LGACLPRRRRLPPRPEAAAPRCAALLGVAVFFAGCASPPVRVHPDTPSTSIPRGEAIARIARDQLGRPYRYGGDGPGGFDCSGLTKYVYASFGIELPRTAAAQHAAATPVARDQLAPGDLVFFRFGSATGVDHVGVHVGDGRFVHAPKAGAPVVEVVLDAPWFARRYVSAGRFAR